MSVVRRNVFPDGIRSVEYAASAHVFPHASKKAYKYLYATPYIITKSTLP